MHKFQDSAGYMWDIDLMPYEVIRLKKATGIDLLQPESPNGETTLHERLYSDFAYLWEMLFAICEPQATKVYASEIEAAVGDRFGEERAAVTMQVVSAAFGRAMAAECIVGARAAFFKEWVALLRSLHRPEIAMVIEKAVNLADIQAEEAREKMSDPRLADAERRAAAKVKREVGDAFDSLIADLDKVINEEPEQVGDNE